MNNKPVSEELRTFLLKDNYLPKIAYEVAMPLYSLILGIPIPAWSKLPEHAGAMRSRVRQHLLGFTQEEAHKEWSSRLISEGWSLAPDRDYVNKTHPHLMAWEDLPWKSKLGHMSCYLTTRSICAMLGQPLVAGDERLCESYDTDLTKQVGVPILKIGQIATNLYRFIPNVEYESEVFDTSTIEKGDKNLSKYLRKTYAILNSKNIRAWLDWNK